MIAERDTGAGARQGRGRTGMGRAETWTKPKLVLLDPRGPKPSTGTCSNNRKRVGRALPNLSGRCPETDFYIHPYFATRIPAGPAHRRGAAHGVVQRCRRRHAGDPEPGSDYLRRFEQNQAWVAGATGWGSDNGSTMSTSSSEPESGYPPCAEPSQTLDAFTVEGALRCRAGCGAGAPGASQLRPHLAPGRESHLGGHR